MVVVLQWRLGLDLALELVEHNLACLSLVELGEHLIGLFLGHVEAARLNYTLDLAAVDLAVAVQIKRVKCLHNIEVWVGSQSLTHTFGRSFDLEVSAPHVAVLNLRVREEAVISLVQVVSVVRWSSVQHVAVVSVVGDKRAAELLKAQSVVLVGVVALEEETNLICRREHTDRSEALPQVSLRHVSMSAVVEDSKAVVQVKVGLVGQHNLGALELSFLGNQVTQRFNKSIFVVGMQSGLVG